MAATKCGMWSRTASIPMSMNLALMSSVRSIELAYQVKKKKKKEREKVFLKIVRICDILSKPVNNHTFHNSVIHKF